MASHRQPPSGLERVPTLSSGDGGTIRHSEGDRIQLEQRQRSCRPRLRRGNLMQTLAFHSLDQSYYPPSLYSIKCVNKVAPIEDSQQPLHRSRRISRPRLDVFSQDPPGVLKGTNEHVLVGVIHSSTPLHRTGIQAQMGNSVPEVSAERRAARLTECPNTNRAGYLPPFGRRPDRRIEAPNQKAEYGPATNRRRSLLRARTCSPRNRLRSCALPRHAFLQG